MSVAAAASVLSSEVAGVVRITLNRPEKRNALDAAMLELLLSKIEDAATARVIILQGAGRSFCAGADVKALAQLNNPEEKNRHATALEAVFLALLQAPVPVIAAVQGHALGAGCGLIACCPLVVAHRDAEFGFPELARGILPALVTPPLVAAIGRRQAQALLLSSRMIGAAEAQTIGLIAEISGDAPLERAELLAEQLAGVAANRLVQLSELCALAKKSSLESALAAARLANIAARS